MIRLYTLLTALMFVGLVNAQTYMVTLEVDMNDEVVDVSGVHVAGSFQEWNEAAFIEMMDMDMDGVYSVTIEMDEGVHEFKFLNGNEWGMEEDVPAGCQVHLTDNTNRQIEVSSDMTYQVCFARCSACNMQTVYFRVDMSLQPAINPDGVHVAGNVQDWDPATTELMDSDGDLIYEGLYEYDPMLLEDNGDLLYKFINGNIWELAEQPEGDCSDDNFNRIESGVGADHVTESWCFGACDLCVQPTMVTFSVDVSDILPVTFVDIAGSFNGWDGAGYEMNELALNIWEITLEVQPGVIEYKFRKDGTQWEEPGCLGGGNRTFDVTESDITLFPEIVCFNQCAWPCVSDPDPADITFRVNMMDVGASSDGVWLIGNFTNPAWQAGAIQMTDADADQVYEATVEVGGNATFFYKYVNGDVTVTDNEENQGLFDGSCGVDNSVGGWNRTYTRSGDPEILDVMCFDKCEDCVVSVSELGSTRLTVYPNPTSDQLNLKMSSVDVKELSLTVYNAQGQIQLTKQINGLDFLTLEVGDWAAGLYTIEVNSGSDWLTQRIFVR
jgi:hypothetical protein